MFCCLCRKSQSWNLPDQAGQSNQVNQVPAIHYGVNGDTVTSVPKTVLNHKTEEIRSASPPKNKTINTSAQNEADTDKIVQEDKISKPATNNDEPVENTIETRTINEPSAHPSVGVAENFKTENGETNIKINDNETTIVTINAEHVDKEITTKTSDETQSHLKSETSEVGELATKDHITKTIATTNTEHIKNEIVIKTSDETESHLKSETSEVGKVAAKDHITKTIATTNTEHVKNEIVIKTSDETPSYLGPETSTHKIEEVGAEDVKTSDNDTQETSVTTEIVKGNDESDGVRNKKRRSGLAGYAANVEKQDIKAIEIVTHAKEKRDEIQIREALANNEFLSNLLEGKRLQAAVDAMYIRDVVSEEVLIREGEIGTQLYISATGTYEISIKDQVIATFNDNRVFGELAILYNAKRQASIRALKPGRVWILDQNAYQHLMLRSEIERHDELLNFLRNVPKLNTVSNLVLGRVTDLLKREFFATGSVIVRQGDVGDKFYIISAGSVTISKEGEGEVGNMVRGEFFGQLALLNDDVRQATVTADAPGVECLSLSRLQFIEHFGSVEDIQSIPDDPKRKSTSSSIENPYKEVELKDFKIIDTLGVGGFGRVELVQHKQNKELTFALKYLKKIDMIQQQQQEHVYNEKLIQISCENIFIVRMYKTMRDNKYLYFLMESCLGGDLWSLLQKQKAHRFDETAARFYAASVLEALAYLHERNIVYRDLKPENLLLDAKGQLKLTDFGFAKKLGPRGKTYTFAGTPEYVAPEIVLNRGHDRAVDYWTLGIFIFELLVGKTPFRSNDTSYMKTYNLIIRGIESVRFPDTVPRKAENLIKKLCRSMAMERLGCQREGAQAVRDHKWFMGLDWNQLRAGQLNAPFKRHLNSAVDTHYFDKYQKDTDIPPDELSGWDGDF